MPPPRVVQGLSRRGLRPSERSWRRVPRDCPRSLRKPPEGVVAELAVGVPPGSLKWSSRVTAGAFQGSRRAPSGAPRGAFERPLLGVLGGVSGRGQGTRDGGRRALGSRSQNVVSSVVSSVASGPSWGPRQEVLRTRVRGAAGRRATLCDSRLRHAVRPVDRETSARRRSGGVPDRQSGPRSPRSSISWPR
jgi:hypothetical protein